MRGIIFLIAPSISVCVKYRMILDEVLERICPSKAVRAKAKKHVGAFISLLRAELKRLAIDAKVLPGGSYAKDTWLAGDFDVDVFVKFHVKYEGEKNISDLLESALLKFSPDRVHGSRDYFRVENDVSFEVVPVLDIRRPEQARNVTDFSPWHVKWVNAEGRELKDDIRLAKQFCKAAKCYGAESYIGGFSGHVVDILVVYYGGFLKFLRAAIKWSLSKKVVIDYNKVYRSKALFVLNESKIQGPLVVIDPVQPERNAAAALTEENVLRLQRAADRFLKDPSEDFFVIRPFDPKDCPGIVVRVEPLEGKRDVVGAKMVRAFEYVKRALDDFGVKDAGWEWNNTAFWWFVLKQEALPKMVEHRGPPLDQKEHVVEFRKKYEDTFMRDGVVYARVERKFTSAREHIKHLLKSKFVKERVTSAICK